MFIICSTYVDIIFCSYLFSDISLFGVIAYRCEHHKPSHLKTGLKREKETLKSMAINSVFICMYLKMVTIFWLISVYAHTSFYGLGCF